MSFAQSGAEASQVGSLRSAHKNKLDNCRDALRVLIVDDHPLVRRALADVLRSVVPAQDIAIKHITECGTLAEAIERLAAGERFDLVLTDLALPDSTGNEAVTQLAPRLPDTPLIVVSGNGRLAAVREALHHGAHGYVIKSSAVAALGDAVRMVLRGDVYVPSNIEREPTSEARSKRGALSPKQLQIAMLAAQGRSNKEIGRELCMSEDGVKYHLRQIFSQIGVPRRSMLREALGDWSLGEGQHAS